MLAECIAPTPSLRVKGAIARAEMFGLPTEIASGGDLAWQRRLQLVDVMHDASDDPKVRQTPDVLASAIWNNILIMLTDRLYAQAGRGRDYFFGDDFIAICTGPVSRNWWRPWLRP